MLVLFRVHKVIRPKTKAELGRIVENWAFGEGGGGVAVQYWGGGPNFFSTYSNGKFFFFLQGPGPPQATMWLRP